MAEDGLARASVCKPGAMLDLLPENAKQSSPSAVRSRHLLLSVLRRSVLLRVYPADGRLVRSTLR